MKYRNENRAGYKKTKAGWIPQEWGIQPFGYMTRKSQYGLSINSSEIGKTPILRMGNIEDGKVTYKNLSYVNVSDLVQYQYSVKKNDLLFNRTNSLDLVGKTGIVTESKPVVFASYLIRFQIDDSLAFPSFVAYYFNTPESRVRIKKLATPGVGQHNINQTELQKYFFISLPSLPEQKKIVEILSIWDEAIEQTRKLIEAKKGHRKALMQQLIGGKSLYHTYGHDNWNVRTLGELIEPVSRPVPKPQNPYLSVGIRSHGKGTFQKIVEQPDKVMMDTLYRVETNDLVVNITFAWEGAIAIASVQDSGGLVSHRFPTYRIRETEADIDFFRNLILTKKFVWNLGLISPGGAGRNRVLNQKDFLKLKVVVPLVEAQKEIGKTLAAADKELHLWEDYLKALEKQKRGLMQKLLTGEVRVKV